MVTCSKLALIGLCAVILPACATHNGATIYEDPSAIAVLSSTQGSSVHGVATFVRSGGVAMVNVNMTGFKPNSIHGLHIHESGDCTARDGSSAGGHFNPTSSDHGGPSGGAPQKRHLGENNPNGKGGVYSIFEGGGIVFWSGAGRLNRPGVVPPPHKG